MKKYIIIIMIVTLSFFLIGATVPPKKPRPADTGNYKVGKYKDSGKKGVGGICFIDASQY